MKEEVKKIERPKEEDIEGCSIEDYLKSLEKYCDQLTRERNEQLEVIAKDIKIIEKQYQEIKALTRERDGLKDKNKILQDIRVSKQAHNEKLSKERRDSQQEIKGLKKERDELKKSRDKHSQLAINVQMELQTLLKPSKH